jgi:hypothetical protein
MVKHWYYFVLIRAEGRQDSLERQYFHNAEIDWILEAVFYEQDFSLLVACPLLDWQSSREYHNIVDFEKTVYGR